MNSILLFYYESKFKIKNNFFGRGEGGGRERGGGREYVNFFHKRSKSEKKMGGGVGWGEGGGVDGWTDEQAQTNCPFNCFKVGDITMH